MGIAKGAPITTSAMLNGQLELLGLHGEVAIFLLPIPCGFEFLVGLEKGLYDMVRVIIYTPILSMPIYLSRFLIIVFILLFI